jgi:hypothetical protein
MSRIELAKIKALTFYKDALTESRRTEAIPQLICANKSVCKLYTPEVVRCQSLGGSGTDIDWKVRATRPKYATHLAHSHHQCEADLPESLRFGKVQVSCEGESPWSGGVFAN